MALPRRAAWPLMLLLPACSLLPEEEPATPRSVAAEPLSPAQASQIYVEKGVHYLEAGQYDVALKDLEKATELDDDNSEACNALGVLYQQIDRPDEADRHFRKAIGLNPDNYGARNNYGRFLCKTGHAEEAFEQFRAVYGTRLYGQPWLPLTNAGLCAQSVGRMAEAERFLRRALEANPRFPPALLAMARLSRDMGQLLAARGFLERALSAAGSTAEALLLGIEIEMALGNRQAAAGYMATLTTRFPDATELMQARQRFGG
ncbi:type IV pilus biogenesis/stability protein PilW [Methyloparacoccus murrellii]|jgi:type IV pilus assembly protein PilF